MEIFGKVPNVLITVVVVQLLLALLDDALLILGCDH